MSKIPEYIPYRINKKKIMYCLDDVKKIYQKETKKDTRGCCGLCHCYPAVNSNYFKNENDRNTSFYIENPAPDKPQLKITLPLSDGVCKDCLKNRFIQSTDILFKTVKYHKKRKINLTYLLELKKYNTLFFEIIARDILLNMGLVEAIQKNKCVMGYKILKIKIMKHTITHNIFQTKKKNVTNQTRSNVNNKNKNGNIIDIRKALNIHRRLSMRIKIPQIISMKKTPQNKL